MTGSKISHRMPTLSAEKISHPATKEPTISTARSPRFAMFRAMRHRNFRLYIFGQSISLIGSWMQSTAQAWLVYELTRSSFWLGMIGFIGSAPLMVLSIFGGAMADRWPKRSLLILTQVVAMVLAFVFAALVWGRLITIAWIGALALGLGIVLAFEWPTRQAFVVELVGKDDLANGIALHSAVFNSARLIGPALGGALIALIGIAWCFFLNGISYLAVIAGLWMMRLPRRSFSSAATSNIRKSLGESFSYVRQTKPVLGLLALVAMVTIFGWSFSVLLPVFAGEILKGDALTLGKLMSAMGSGALLSALTVAAIGNRIAPRRVLFSGLTILVISVCCFAISRDLNWSVGLLVLVGFGLITFYITANTALQRRVPDHLRGRAMGIYAVAFGGLMPIGSLQAGLMAEKFGAVWTVIIGGVICALAGYVVSRMVPPSPSLQPPVRPNS
jgi:MFS family permease